MAEAAPIDSSRDQEWRTKLTKMQYRVTRQGDTERPFTGEFWNNHRDGSYRCVCCDAVLFDSGTKFDSGSGWPSFWEPTGDDRITLVEDRTHGMVRTEVRCASCDAHLGHLFEDGPEPTGCRYCINSASLAFEEKSAP